MKIWRWWRTWGAGRIAAGCVRRGRAASSGAGTMSGPAAAASSRIPSPTTRKTILPPSLGRRVASLDAEHDHVQHNESEKNYFSVFLVYQLFMHFIRLVSNVVFALPPLVYSKRTEKVER
jgi:hypothetical protein